MINSTTSYQSAIVADVRRMWIQAIIDIIDPDLVYGQVATSDILPYSKPAQIHDKEVVEPVKYATLEPTRWLLNGEFQIFPADPEDATDTGIIGTVLSGDGGVFATSQYAELQFSNVSILQACSIYFPTNNFDGYPVDFTVEIKQNGVSYYTATYTDNTQTKISVDGFTVYEPDAIRVTVTKWSAPGRRFRLIEIIPGIYEEWSGGTLSELSVKHQGDVSCVTLPYGTCTLRMDNLDRRFEPRSKNGVFQSIEERQGIPVSLGVSLPDGSIEYKPVGVYYQHSGGWETGDNGITMQWDLVDIIGLLADREYILPDTLPTTLSGWLASLVAQLGDNFADRYSVDANYADLPLTTTAADITGMTCGDILRYACMATATWPRSDAETGYLTAEPLWDAGNKLTLDNMEHYPTMKSNPDLAAVIFTINDSQYVVSGNSTAASETVSVDNPFITTTDQALTAARQILTAYGGNRYEIVGRGDPASEIGDVDTVWLNESSATTARRIQQDFTFQNGVLQGCNSVLIQSDGSFLFTESVIITESGTWTAPDGVNQIRVIIVGGGAGGEDGEDGDWDYQGENGADGAGGRVWSGTFNINNQQIFNVSIGAGGTAGNLGQDTTFGSYSSANGEYFTPNYTDIASGNSYARTGVQSPLAGSGDGGKGGKGGRAGKRHTEQQKVFVPISTTLTTRAAGDAGVGPPIAGGYRDVTVTVVDRYPGKGESGTTGGSGCVVVYWAKPEK